MTRPLDWAPLAERDPLPGDPDEILTEARRLQNMAVELISQVGVLHRMAAAGTGDGEYLVALRKSAADVAGKLEKVHDRYVEVYGCLNGWAQDLAEYQEATWKVLRKAQALETTLQRNPHDDLIGAGPFAYQTLLAAGPAGDAEAQLRPLRYELDGLLEQADARAAYWADKIGDAIDDKLTDGFMDHLHSWVERNAGWLKTFNRDLGYVATVAAIAAMVAPAAFVPGLNVVVLGATATLLASHTTMLAGGDGSWVEVGLDVVALASFGTGKIVGGRLEGIMKDTRLAAATSDGEKAAEAVMQGPGAKVAARAAGERAAIRAGQAQQLAMRQVMEAPKVEVSTLQSLWAGAREDATSFHTTRALLRAHPENTAVRNAALNLERDAAIGRANWMIGTSLDVSDKIADKASGSYRTFKEGFARSGGAID